MKKKTTKLLLIGWDAADWKFINPLMDAGLMPSLQGLVENGVMGNLATLDPPLSPMLWTSIATGKTADQHGILGFTEPDPETGKARPVSCTSRKVKAIWNILTHEGYKTHLVGWWPSYPAEPINGICVSNHFAEATTPLYTDNWNLAPSHVHPIEHYDTLRKLRLHPNELTWAHLLPFLPNGIDKTKENPKLLNTIAILLAQCSTYHAVTTWILENQDWDFCGLYMDTIDKAAHEFMKFHPPYQAHLDEAEFLTYKDVMIGFYRYHDMMLERLLELAGQDAHIMLVSDHGFYADHRRLEKLPNDPMAPALEHSPYGVFCLKGEGIKQDERVYGASLLDITPTILTLFGLPLGKDMAGKVITQAFETLPNIQYIDSWENVEGGNWGEHDTLLKEDPWSAQAALLQLAELGYIDPLPENKAAQLAAIQFESQFNLARVYMSTGRPNEAVQILEQLYKEKPNLARVNMRLVNAYLRLQRIEEARHIVNLMREQFGDKETPFLDFLEGKIYLAEHRPFKALTYFERAANSQQATADLFVQLGQTFVILQEWLRAQDSFEKALNLDHENASAHHGLAIALLRQEYFEAAAESALQAVSIQHFLPGAHYHLGEALFKLEDYNNAAQAFEVTLSMNPHNKRARLWLLTIYNEHLHLSDKAAYHQNFITQQMRPQITIVSGLPRSGTSMMMQMLKAGGLDILTDELRASDDNNPKGYMEYDPVKRLHQDNTWLKSADGKTIKVIAQLLPHLSADCDYKIIFMQRDIDEILQSQQKMLGRPTNAYPTNLAQTFQRQLEKINLWLKGQPNIKVHFVDYTDIIKSPREQAENVRSFLGESLDLNAMTQAVDPSLHRNRA